MREFRWTRIHLPSGRRYRMAGEFESALDFYRYINGWNALSKGEWLYIADANVDLPPLGLCKNFRELSRNAETVR